MSFPLPPHSNQPPPGIHQQATPDQIKQAQNAQRIQQQQERARRQSEIDAEIRRRAEETGQGR